ncbi:MAG: sensor histidine kinase KdpD [Clostridia bacterium]|nr:sensor histidine kinase KdpD [Clostridia bacterium]
MDRKEHILVCLSSAPSNAKIIRTAARMAAAFSGSFTALYVETPDFSAMEEENKKRLEANTRLARKLGATIETVQGDDVPYQIAEFARLSGVTKIVLGRSAAGRHRLFGKPTLTDRLIAIAPNVDIHIIPDGASNRSYRPRKARKKLPKFSIADAAKSVIILLAVSLINMVFYGLGFTDANIIMVYILGVLVTAIVTTHQIYSIASAVLSVILFNFIFTEPRFSLHAFDAGYPITFAVMFLAAYITGTLAIRLKDNARQSAQAAYRTRILFDTDQLLNRAENRDEIISILAGQLIKLLNRDIVIYQKNGETLETPAAFTVDGHVNPSLLTTEERTVAEWVAKNNRHAGATTDRFTEAVCLYLAIRINQRVYGVVGIAMNGDKLDSFENSVLLSMLGEGALALENEKNAREKEEAAILARNEQLRANLLRAISHDLRTPLTSISGNASILLSGEEAIDESTRQQLYANIHDESIWLINLVENLLSVTRIEDGRMNLNPSAELIDEIIDEALRHVNRRSMEHKITVEKEKDYSLVHADAKLIVQVLINLIDNAVKYAPQSSEIRISVREQDGMVHVSVSDNGPGIPDGDKDRIFEMFYTGASHAADSRRSLGLGLSLCRSIIHAHGGSISVRDNHPSGAIFEFTLPSEEVSIHE